MFLLFSHPPSEQHHSRPERRCNYRRHYPAAEREKDRVACLPPGKKRDALLEKARLADLAARINSINQVREGYHDRR
jgi:hypothetical protein